jgi:hypothetical protein
VDMVVEAGDRLVPIEVMRHWGTTVNIQISQVSSS